MRGRQWECTRVGGDSTGEVVGLSSQQDVPVPILGGHGSRPCLCDRQHGLRLEAPVGPTHMWTVCDNTADGHMSKKQGDTENEGVGRMLQSHSWRPRAARPAALTASVGLGFGVPASAALLSDVSLVM